MFGGSFLSGGLSQAVIAHSLAWLALITFCASALLGRKERQTFPNSVTWVLLGIFMGAGSWSDAAFVPDFLPPGWMCLMVAAIGFFPEIGQGPGYFTLNKAYFWISALLAFMFVPFNNNGRTDLAGAAMGFAVAIALCRTAVKAWKAPSSESRIGWLLFLAATIANLPGSSMEHSWPWITGVTLIVAARFYASGKSVIFPPPRAVSLGRGKSRSIFLRD